MKIIGFILMLASLVGCNENFSINVKNPTGSTPAPGPVTPPGPPAPTPFITKWKTDNFGPNTSQITLYLTAGYDYDFVVDWGDGTTSEIDAWDDVDTVHNYTSGPNTYIVSMLGKIPSIHCNNGWDDGKKLIEITQWGNNKWEKLDKAFAYSEVQITATDAPDLSLITNLEEMFDFSSMNSSIGHWNVSTVTNMKNMFRGASNFNGNISAWNTSNVTDMSGMFYNAPVFNQNINSWNVSKVTDMNYMFSDADAFNQNLNSWNTGEVTNMSYMFASNAAFNGNISNWNTSKVANMNSMFYNTTAFNQNINGWVVSAVTNMGYMFSYAAAFDQDLNSWDTHGVTNMQQMFSFAAKFDGNISSWNLSSLNNMNSMFYGASLFNQNLSTWIVPSGVDHTDYDSWAPLWTNPVDKPTFLP